jgi:hypothetical protein
MKTLTRKVCVFCAALILAVVLTSATGSPRRAYAGCGSDVSWQIRSEMDDRQTSDTVGGKTTDTQDISSRSEQHSDNGQDSSDVQTNHVNPDGSSHDHEEYHYSDSQGKGCYSDGVPWKGDSRDDDDTDSKGNRKEHHEEIIEKNGKCEKYVRDREWDSKGKLIKETHSNTDVPCGKYILEWSRVGNVSAGGVEVLWGPNTTKIYLEPKGDGTSKGNGEGVIDAKWVGKCVGFATQPFSVDVTAKEVKFGDQDELDFSVKVTMSSSGFITCDGKGISQSNPPVTFTNNFSIPIEDGATFTKVVPMPAGSGQITDTFTLKKR